MTKNIHQELLRRLKAAKDADECRAVMEDAIAALRDGSITPDEVDQLCAENELILKRLETSLRQATR